MNHLKVISICIISLKAIVAYPQVEKTDVLVNTNWTSSFFYYVNNYHFTTYSTGYSEDGQLAGSMLMAPLLDCKSLDSVFYDNPLAFNYYVSANTLILNYLNKDVVNIRKFIFDSKSECWVSVYEYVYGREWLTQNEKIWISN